MVIALVRCALLKMTWMIPSTWGNISPELMPCTTRETMRVSASGATPQTAEATVKPAIPHRNIFFRP